MDIIHGVDYYPEQWLEYPEILSDDIKMMKKAHINTVVLGVFAWDFEEPEEGIFDFSWLYDIVSKLYKNGINTIIATPSGARPAWLAKKYPEVLRVREDRTKNLYGMRMNHCYTSPIYRDKVRIIDDKIASVFYSHPAVIGWHISNEYHGECHCELCQEAFREYLKSKYGSIDCLNNAWWSSFWSKKYTSWSQIESPSSIGERALSGLELDWKRFVTFQTRDFMKMEVETVRKYGTDKFIASNMIGSLIEIDYPHFSDILDIAGLDVYPQWGRDDNVPDEAGFQHDVTRGFKRKPYFLMETTPSMTNWEEVCQPKRPGIHMLSAIQAIAHGSDSFIMFQWRKPLGGFEKFHGAVVSHDGCDDSRVFLEVSETGAILEKLSEIQGSEVKPDVAILFDWENRWAIKASKGPRGSIDPDQRAFDIYRILASQGIDVDVISSDFSIDQYKVVIAPLLYMVKAKTAENIKDFVRKGGVFIATCFSGVVDEYEKCFLGGAPGPISDVLGIKSKELFTLYCNESNRVDSPVFSNSCKCTFWCDILKLHGAEAFGVYRDDFFSGSPAITVNSYGMGKAWYIGTDLEYEGLEKLITHIIKESDVKQSLLNLPLGVRVHRRSRDLFDYLFCLNFNNYAVSISIPDAIDFESGVNVTGNIELKPYGYSILKLIR